MTFSLPNIVNIMDKGVQTFKRFPFAILSSILTTCIAIYFIEFEPHELKGANLILMKLAATSMLGVFVFTAVRLLEENLTKKGTLFALSVSVIGLVGYYLSLPDEMQGFSALIYIFKHIFLILLFFVAILWTPFVKSHLPNVDYWEYAKTVLFSLAMTVLFSIVVILGINAALYAVEMLFDFSIRGKYYFITDVLIVGIFSVTYFLSQIPEKPLSSKATLPPVKVEKFFTQYILTPLTGLYFVILYVYTAKVLVTMDWPKGILAWLIVAFSIVAVLTYLFWTHFLTNPNSKWRKWIWLAIFLQTLMLFVAIGMRIAEYSWTENRYMVVVLGLWLAGISLYFLLFENAKIKWIFVSLSLLIGISQVGPFSAYAVSKKAQTARLLSVLQTYKLEKSSLNTIPIKVRYEISDITQYLYDRYSTKALAPIFPKITAEFNRLDTKLKEAQKAFAEQRKRDKKLHKPRAVMYKNEFEEINKIFNDKPRYFPHFVTHTLGFKFVNFWEYQNYGKTKSESINFTIDRTQARGMRAQEVRGYDYMLQYYGNSGHNERLEVDQGLWRLSNIDVNIALEKSILHIQHATEVLTFDIGSFIKELVKKNRTNNKALSQEELTLLKENVTLKVKIEFQHLNQNNYDGKKSLNFNAVILFKMKGEQ